MATRKTESPAAINRRIDALNKGRGKNPARDVDAASVLKQLKRFVAKADALTAKNRNRNHIYWDPVDVEEWGKLSVYVIRSSDALGVPESKAWKFGRGDISRAELFEQAKRNPARASRVSTLVARKHAAKNPARKPAAKLPSTEYEVQYSPNGSDWHKWTSVLYEDMAKAIATRTAKEFPKYHVRVIRKS